MPSEARARRHRRFLLNEVFPHLKDMPKRTDLTSDEVHRYTSAVLDFNTYCDRGGKARCEISKKYDCGFVGCLGGWYYMLAEDWGHIVPEENHEVSSFDFDYLADHFGIESFQAAKLFGSHGNGAEENEFNDPGSVTISSVLRSRKKYLTELMVELGDLR